MRRGAGAVLSEPQRLSLPQISSERFCRLVGTGLKDMELVASTCAAAGIDAPLLRHSIRALEELGVEGFRSNLTAVMEALRAS